MLYVSFILHTLPMRRLVGSLVALSGGAVSHREVNEAAMQPRARVLSEGWLLRQPHHAELEDALAALAHLAWVRAPHGKAWHCVALRSIAPRRGLA